VSPALTENALENATLDWLEQLGWSTLFGPDIAPGEPASEREDYGQVVLVGRLQAALGRINPDLF